MGRVKVKGLESRMVQIELKKSDQRVERRGKGSVDQKERRGPKGRHSIAAAVRPWHLGKLDTEARRAGTRVCRTFGAQNEMDGFQPTPSRTWLLNTGPSGLRAWRLSLLNYRRVSPSPRFRIPASRFCSSKKRLRSRSIHASSSWAAFSSSSLFSRPRRSASKKARVRTL
jgi:hypothetical protein